MPSSFDPLALVKAMGPQRDPYSWAELYAADASKHQLTREELKNRLLMQEMTREERAKEGAADRASREGIAREGRNLQRDRITAASKNFEKRLAAISKDIIWPKGTMSEKEAENAAILKPGEDVGKTHQRMTLHGITKVVPLGTMPTRPNFSNPTPRVPDSDDSESYTSQYER